MRGGDIRGSGSSSGGGGSGGGGSGGDDAICHGVSARCSAKRYLPTR